MAGGQWASDPRSVTVDGFCFDARQIKPGDCFVALRGAARDGHQFLAQALAGGAVAAVVEEVCDVALPQLLVQDSLLALGRLGAAARGVFKNPVIGVTGSCGKTSTKEMLRLLLGGDTGVHATAANWNNRIGVPMTLLPLYRQAHTFAVVEAGINQPQEMQLLAEMIQADLTVVTNVAAAHLELLGDLELVAREKSLLAQSAHANSPIVLPCELLQYTAFSALAARAVVLCPAGVTCDLPVRRKVYFSSQMSTGGLMQLKLHDDCRSAVYSIHSSSCGMAQNAALAILAARELGVHEPQIQARISAWRPSPNRGQVVQSGAQTFYIDCYNANPASMLDALSAFTVAVSADLPRIYVLGAMNELGQQAEAWHHSIGRALKLRTQDRVYFVGPALLTEAYTAGAISRGADAQQIRCFKKSENLKTEIAVLPSAVFLKGSRGYALEQLMPRQR
jgi:UDP-N-acetylmuramoyl-tripeptide--D-alanyl-D-alanine ligase